MLKLSRAPFLCFTTLLLLITFSYETEARRLHNHRDKENPNPKIEPPCSSISQSQPPSISPNPNDPSPSQEPDDHGSVYDVRNYGAVGDGVTDDTESFKTAWDLSCSNENNNNTSVSVLLVPYGFIFMIHSTIFTGPCRSYQYFQVPIF